MFNIFKGVEFYFSSRGCGGRTGEDDICPIGGILHYWWLSSIIISKLVKTFIRKLICQLCFVDYIWRYIDFSIPLVAYNSICVLRKQIFFNNCVNQFLIVLVQHVMNAFQCLIFKNWGIGLLSPQNFLNSGRWFRRLKAKFSTPALGCTQQVARLSWAQMNWTLMIFALCRHLWGSTFQSRKIVSFNRIARLIKILEQKFEIL